MNKSIFAGFVAASVLAAGTAVAAMAPDFANGAKVNIPGLSDRGSSVYTLTAKGADGNGDGKYLIQSATGPYLSATKSDAGTMVGWTNGPDASKATVWILHKNKAGWSIIHSGNGANTVTKDPKSVSGLSLSRNQGYAPQLFAITAK